MDDLPAPSLTFDAVFVFGFGAIAAGEVGLAFLAASLIGWITGSFGRRRRDA